MTLICCPALFLAETCHERRPSHVLTLASPGQLAPPLPAEAAHLHLSFNDIAEARPGLVQPSIADVEQLIAFGRSWDGVRPLLVSCEAGISRSPAALFIIACEARPTLPERELASLLRRASRYATPNPLLVSLADRILGRRDRMIQAIAAIGRGADYQPYRSFALALPAAG